VSPTIEGVAIVRMFASAREAAGTGRDVVPGETVGEVLATATERFGPRFGEVLASCRIWVNGDDATDATTVSDDDEVAVLPPVSGGCS
jgi:molybdopterin synthase sulfur carrier subunit